MYRTEKTGCIFKARTKRESYLKEALNPPLNTNQLERRKEDGKLLIDRSDLVLVTGSTVTSHCPVRHQLFERKE
jgi:hypothetical protein